MRRLLPGGGFFFLALASCQGGTMPAGARLEARWTGADTSHFSAEASAEWCDTMRVLTIEAMRGDTGIALAIYPGDSIVGGSFAIHRPVRPDAPGESASTSLAPSAALALRWFSKTIVRGFQGDSGQVTLTRSAGGRLGGRFGATARSLYDDGHVTVTGTFTGVRVRQAGAGCGRRSSPSAARSPAAPAPDSARRDSLRRDSLGVD